MKMYKDFDVSKYFKALLFDFFLFYGLLIAIMFFGAALIFFLKILSIEFSSSLETSFILLLVFIVWYLYFFIFFKKTGQTLGMKVFKIKIVSVNLKSLSYGQILWWGIFIPIPITIFFEILNMRVPPYFTLLESRTNARIKEVE